MKKRIISLFISTAMLLSATAVNAAEYLDITKRSIGEAADASGYTFEEYKKYMAIDDDVPAWESEHAAEFGSSAMNMAKAYGMTADEFKKEFNVTIDITETTTMGEVYDSIPLSSYFGDDFQIAKQVYGFTDDITPNTLYGKVRHIVEPIDMASIDRKVFTDVGYNHWAHYYITKMLEDEIIDGYDDGTYQPEKTVTRAEFAKILAETAILGSTAETGKYADVADDAWYAKYVNIMDEYIAADENGNFNPEAPATREVVATAIVKVLGVADDASATVLAEKFTDSETVTAENALYVADAVNKGIIDGFEDDTIRGNDSLTRAQAATVLYRAFNEYANISPAFDIVVMKSGDYEITLGDALLCYPLEESGYEDADALNAAISDSVNQLARLMMMESIAKEKNISYDDALVVAVQSRATIASSYGYKEFCNVLNESGTDIEFYDKYVLMLSYEKMLEQIENYKLPTEIELNADIEIYEDAWADVTLADIAKG